MAHSFRVCSKLFVVFAAGALALLIAAPTQTALAAEPGIYSATATVYYANPDTGVIEDPAGESNTTLGQTMVEGTVQPEALLEVDSQGNSYLSLRFKLANEIGDVLVASDADHTGTFSSEELAQQVQILGEGDIADYRFAIPREDATIRVNMFVEPMGRNVVYFVGLSNIVEGNAAGFVESIEPPAAAPAESSSVAPAPAAETPTQPAPATTSTSAAAASSQPEKAEEPAPTATNETSSQPSSNTGVKEYSGDGNEVTGAGAQSNTAASNSLNYPLIIGIIAAIAAIIGLIVYFGVVKPRNARQDAAAAAAAAPQDEGE